LTGVVTRLSTLMVTDAEVGVQKYWVCVDALGVIAPHTMNSIN